MDERLKLLERLKLQLNGYVKTGEKTYATKGFDQLTLCLSVDSVKDQTTLT